MLSNTIIPYHDGVYEGSIMNGVPNGWGTKLTYFNDVVYEGEWRNGQEHGKGTITWWNGCSFTGSLLNYSPLVLSPGTLCTSFSTRGILIVTQQLLIKRFDYLIINFLLYELFHCSFGNRTSKLLFPHPTNPSNQSTPTSFLSSLFSIPTYHLFYA